jgi:hypothetical protein
MVVALGVATSISGADLLAPDVSNSSEWAPLAQVADDLSADPPQQLFAVGGGYRLIPPFGAQNFAFAGQQTPTGPRGYMVYDYIVGSTQEVAKVRASVDCLFVLGNRAELAGLIQGESPIPGLQYADLVVQDNGQPGAGIPDEITQYLVGSDAPPRPGACFGLIPPSQVPAANPITGGNIVVHDGS